ncbi:MAG: ethanolamine utilization protein [Betaproteobacteria bacterium]|nr:ethanolamine utilization protein [Betaproteobacteria bacterium]
MLLLDAPLAIVDVETTGTNPVYDRVTEIAVIEAEGGEITSQWSTLVDPQTPIPGAIQALTGITNEMVAGAPTFGALADDLYERLDGRVFVAHNARFDYGFLRNEFERAGLRFTARTLCTVRLSRKLYPEHARHNLDAVMARHNLACSARHRALGDAEVVWRFLEIALSEHGSAAFAKAAAQVAKQPTLPTHIDRSVIDAIPDAPGVYVLHGESGTPLYVGKSITMRTRVMQHFADDVHSAKEMELAREVRSIEWERTAGELGALLREAELVKELLPVFNRRLRRAADLCSFSLIPVAGPSSELRLVSLEGLDAACMPQLYGLFRSRRTALNALRALADDHALCLQTLGYDNTRGGNGACFRRQIQRCAGACAGAETLQTHQARLVAALAGLKIASWIWRGPIGVIEADRENEATDVHLIDHWCYLGTAKSDAEVGELLEGARLRFDIDQYKLLVRHLRRPGVRVVELTA